MSNKKQSPKDITAIERIYINNYMEPDELVKKSKDEIFKAVRELVPEVPWAIENAVFGYYHTVSMQAFKEGFVIGMKVAEEVQSECKK